MARATHVKKARRAVPAAGIEVGDEYWWWAFKVGGRGSRKHFSKTPPKRSQLTQSEFYAAVYDLEDDVISKLEADDSLPSSVEDVASRLREIADEQQEKLDAMPDGLQSGPTGELLQERIDAMNNAADEFDQIDFDSREDDQSESEHWQAKLEEVQGISIETP